MMKRITGFLEDKYQRQFYENYPQEIVLGGSSHGTGSWIEDCLVDRLMDGSILQYRTFIHRLTARLNKSCFHFDRLFIGAPTYNELVALGLFKPLEPSAVKQHWDITMDDPIIPIFGVNSDHPKIWYYCADLCYFVDPDAVSSLPPSHDREAFRDYDENHGWTVNWMVNSHRFDVDRYNYSRRTFAEYVDRGIYDIRSGWIKTTIKKSDWME